jgi:8-oxo-dGTP pyrophosphatase MutT (NUDIX family)
MTDIQDKIRAALVRPPHVIHLDSFRLAAVAMIFTPGDDLLLMRRATHDKDPWSGHVSFPGGRREPDDQSALETATRETMEELGFPLGDSEFVGRIDDLRTIEPLPPILIQPHVFFLTEEPTLHLNHEVVSVHRLSIHSLLANKNRTTMRHPWRGTPRSFPCVEFDGLCLWGLTLHMVDDLLHRLDQGGRGLQRLPAIPRPDAFDLQEAAKWER